MIKMKLKLKVMLFRFASFFVLEGLIRVQCTISIGRNLN